MPPLIEGGDWPAEPPAPFGNGGAPTTTHSRLATAVDVSRALAGGYCSVLRRVPKQLSELWGASLELVFDLAARDSEAKQTAGYALLVLLPSLTLRFARGERGRAGSYNAMAHRLTRFLVGCSRGGGAGRVRGVRDTSFLWLKTHSATRAHGAGCGCPVRSRERSEAKSGAPVPRDGAGSRGVSDPSDPTDAAESFSVRQGAARRAAGL